MYKERPILFQTDIVRATLEDRKTQIRRTRGLDQINKDNSWIHKGCGIPKSPSKHIKDNCYAIFTDPNSPLSPIVESPYGKPGDLLWVRETFFDTRNYKQFPLFNGAVDFWYRADDEFIGEHKWKPSIHMPKEAARIWLIVEDVRVERLHDISEEDAKAEGVKYYPLVKMYECYICAGKKHKVDDTFHDCGEINKTAKLSFQSLWYEINGQESWDKNPWVWVVKFRVLSKNGKPSEEYIEHAREFLKEKKEVQHG